MSSAEKSPAYPPSSSAQAIEDKEQSATNVSTDQPEGNVDKIREIIFGGQMRDYDKKFSRLEERLTKESLELREETKRLFSTLEAFIHKELESLADSLRAEQQNREGSVNSLTRKLYETGEALESKLQQSVEQTTRGHRELRQQILEQANNLTDEMRRKDEDIAAMVNREVADLNHVKTDRAALAALFTEVAMRLNNEFNIPNDN